MNDLDKLVEILTQATNLAELLERFDPTGAIPEEDQQWYGHYQRKLEYLIDLITKAAAAKL